MIDPNFKTKVRKIFNKYKILLLIPHYWKIHIKIDGRLTIYAYVVYNYPKKQFDISINPKLNSDLNVLKDSILHELIHIFLTPNTFQFDRFLQKIENKEDINIKNIKRKLLSYEERLVSKLAKIIIKQEKVTDDS